MKKKWSSEKVRRTQKWLVERWPDIFTPGRDLRPLTVKIHKDILKHRDENPAVSHRTLREALHRHTRSYGYLYGLLKHTNRFDLDGNQAELILGEHRECARLNLRSMQRKAQKRRKEKSTGMPGHKNVPHHSCNTKPPGAQQVNLQEEGHDHRKARSPVIRYKQSRRRSVSAKETIELAS